MCQCQSDFDASKFRDEQGAFWTPSILEWWNTSSCLVCVVFSWGEVQNGECWWGLPGFHNSTLLITASVVGANRESFLDPWSKCMQGADALACEDCRCGTLYSLMQVFPYIFEEPLGTFHDLEAGETYYATWLRPLANVWFWFLVCVVLVRSSWRRMSVLSKLFLLVWHGVARNPWIQNCSNSQLDFSTPFWVRLTLDVMTQLVNQI